MMKIKPMVGSNDTSTARPSPLQLVPTPALPPDATINDIQFDAVAAAAAKYLTDSGLTLSKVPSLSTPAQPIRRNEAA